MLDVAHVKLEGGGLDGLLKKLEEVGGSVPRAVEKALSQASKKASEDTHTALKKANLPAHGKFSSGRTEGTIIGETAVKWEGAVASVPVGFNLSKPGAGLFLIHGTPRMPSDRALNHMYNQKPYVKEIQKEMGKIVLAEITEAMQK